jgi:hypothetical protein
MLSVSDSVDLLQDCTAAQTQQGADFVLFEGFDIIFSLLGEFNKSATVDMKQQGEHSPLWRA